MFYFSEGQMLDCNMFILKDSQNNLCLIDTGNGLSLNSFIEALSDLGLDYKNITKIQLTHDHLDHIMGLYPLLEKLKETPPEIYAHDFTADLIEEGNENKVVPALFGISAKKFGINVVPLKISNA